ncbi:outer membrane protein [Lasius niger]|uniref:Outer membrane protein n=1 Tax=Lasius niger TaxID=67767 RepID=A0A0J7L0T0_LASNI|nr:outer membrane protein [Lasius niger]
MRAAFLRADVQTVGNNTTIGATRAGLLVVGATGTIGGSVRSNITVTSQHLAATAGGFLQPSYPAGNGTGTLFVGAYGEADNVTVNAKGAIAAATGGGVIDGAAAYGGGSLIASSGGVIKAGDNQHNVSNAFAGQGGTVSAFNGGTVSGVVASGDWEGVIAGHAVTAVINVGNQGVVSGGTVQAYGTVNVANAGTLVSGLISGGVANYGIGWGAATPAIANISDGGIASNLSVYGAGTVNDGGIISGATLSGIYNGGLAGAAAYSGAPVVNVSGANAQLLGGTVSGVESAVVGANVGAIGLSLPIPGYSGVGATVNVSAGGIASNLDVGPEGSVNVGAQGVLSGGILSGSYASAGAGIVGVGASGLIGGSAFASIGDGGSANDENVSVFGVMNAGSGAKLTNDSAFGGTINVGAGATMVGGEASGFYDGGMLLGLGAHTYSGVINVSGQQAQLSGATADAYGTILAQNGGTIVGGTALDSTLDANGNVIPAGALQAGSGGTVLAADGANVSNATALAYGTVAALNGGIVANVTASANGTTLASGGIVSGATAFTGGTLVASANSGIISNAIVSNGGTAVASGQGLITGGIVNYNGTEIASDGGTVSGADVQSSGQLYAENGGTAGGTVESGGSIWANAGGLVSNATLFSGARLNSPGKASGIWGQIFGTAIGTGLVSGATYNSITLESGVVFGMSSGSMSNVTINGGAAIGIYSSGAVVSGATVYGDPKAGGASIDALNGGTVYAATAFSGGLVAAGGVGAISMNGISSTGDQGGTSLMSGALIESGGVGLVGGNKNLTVTKGGTQVTLEGAGISSDAVVDAGGLFDVNSQGTMLGGTVAGTLLVEDGGTMSAILFSGPEANGYVDVGALANSNIIEAGGTLAFNGGSGANNTVQAGGEIDVGVGASRYLSVNDSGAYKIASGTDLNHGVVTSTYVGSKGVLSVGGSTSFVGKDNKATTITGGTALGATVANGGTMVVAAGAYASGATIGAGQDDFVPGKGLVDPAGKPDKYGIGDGGYIAAGGTLESAVLADGSVGANGKIDQMGGLLRVQPGATVTDLHMGWYGQIEVTDVNYSAGESVIYTNGAITLMSDNHSVWDATLDNNGGSGYKASGFQVWDDNGHPVIVYDKCFLKGTRIWTSKGYVTVEQLKEGDSILAMVDGKEVERTITAMRRQRSNIKRDLPIDVAGWSVCVRAGALGDNLPERDLRVTPEHCFYFEGRFLPIRMLVNGFSIYYDTSLEHFDFFHFETEPHSIVRAEGVLTESWLNTEKRRQAVNLSNGITRLETIPSRNWERDAAAPLDVSAPFAEKLWQKFNNRALNLGMDLQAHQNLVFDNNPNIRLRLDDGREIYPRNRRGNKFFFQLPAGVKGASLLSKTFRPSETVGPWVDDRRKLGVLVGKIKVAIGDEFRDLDAHTRVANAQGWDVVENIPCRWTKGDALLPVLGTEEELRGGASLIIEVLAGGPYPKDQEDGKKDNFSDVPMGNQLTLCLINS